MNSQNLTSSRSTSLRETAEIRAAIISVLTNEQKSIDSIDLKTRIQPKLDEFQCSDKGYYGIVGSLVRSCLIAKSLEGGYIVGTDIPKPNFEKIKRSPEEKKVLKRVKQQLWRALKVRSTGAKLSEEQTKLISAYEKGIDLVPYLIPLKKKSKIPKIKSTKDDILQSLNIEILQLQHKLELTQRQLKLMIGVRDNYCKVKELK